MVIYFADRWGKVLSSAATDLPNNSHILDDLVTDHLSSGIRTFECTLVATEELRNTAVTGNYVMAYDRPFTIITSRYYTEDNTLELYCEDAGLDLINKIVGTISKQEKTFKDWIVATLGSESSSGWKYNYNIKNTKKELEYTSEASATERLLDILDNYDAEMYFTYSIEGFKWISRQINFVPKRGSADKVHNLYINKEVKSISREESVMDLATVWRIYGKDKKKLSELAGYSKVDKSYPAEGKRKHNYKVVGNDVICTDAVNEWKSKLDKDGKIMQKKYTEYKDADKAIAYAIRKMEKIVEPVITCEVEMVYLPDGIECGDYVNILDAHDDVLLKARVLEWSKSETKGTADCVLGNFSELESNMAEIEYSGYEMYTLSITSTSGLIGKDELNSTLTAKVWINGMRIEESEDLINAVIRWYHNGELVTTKDSNEFPHISADGLQLYTGKITENQTYICRLENPSNADILAERQITLSIVYDGMLTEEQKEKLDKSYQYTIYSEEKFAEVEKEIQELDNTITIDLNNKMIDLVENKLVKNDVVAGSMTWKDDDNSLHIVGTSEDLARTYETVIGGDGIKFKYNGETVASINQDELIIDKTVVYTSSRVGDWIWEIDTNDNLSLRWGGV